MIKLLTSEDKFIALEYAMKNHIECTFLIGNLNAFPLSNDKTIRRCADYYGYFEDEKLLGMIGFYNLGSCIPHFETENAIPYFVNLLKQYNFSYLLGMSRIINPLYEGIREYKKLQDFSEDSYFINDDFKPFKLDDVEFIEATDFELNKAIEFMAEARKIGFGDEPDYEDLKKSLLQRPKEENFIFAVKEGKILAQACIQTTTSEINQIGGVYTTVNERGKGYCKAVVSELCKVIVERGKLPTLMVRKNNTPAVRAYSSLGFRYYADYSIIEINNEEWFYGWDYN